MKKIIIVRIKGKVDIDKSREDTMSMLLLRKKYACSIYDDKKEIIGMLKKIRNYVMYGIIEKETLKQLIEKRARMQGNVPFKASKETIDKFVAEFFEGKKKFKDLKIKSFFRLNPHRGGFLKSTKLEYPKGVLGNNKEINKLILRML